MCCNKVRVSARISMGRLRAPMTFKFGEVASFVVKDNLYYARPSASTATENRLFLTTSTKSKLTLTNVLSFKKKKQRPKNNVLYFIEKNMPW